MTVERYIFGPFETNTYVVADGKGGVLLVDPACTNRYEQQQLFDAVNRYASPVRIIATHGHLDHLWGAAWACDQWKTPVEIHLADMPMAQAMQTQYDMFGVRMTAKPFPMEPLRPEGCPFEVIETPGHTPGSICLWWKEDHILLSGDTLFQMGYGRTDLPGGNTGQLIASLEKLFDLPAETRVYPGHGDMTTIGAERR